MDVLTELVAKITTDASGLKSGLSQAEGVTEKSSQAMQASLRKVGMAMVAVGAAITGAMGLALKASTDYELAFTGVRKTVTATTEEFAAMSKGITDMSKILPVAATDLAAIAETAGQLGIAKENILSFTEVIAGLGIATDITGQDGATMIARFSAVTRMPESKIKNLASTVVELGNNSRATEAEIMNMALRIGGTASIIGMTEQETLGLSATLVSLGVAAERGGTALNLTMMEMNSAVAEGGDKLETWAKVAGLSAAEFADSFREDAMGTIIDVMGGLKQLNDSGQDTAGILQSIGLGGTRAVETLFKLATAEDEVSSKVDMANRAWEENIALDEEVSRFNEALANQWIILKNVVTAFAITIGNKLAPVVQGFIGLLKPIIDGLTKWAEAHPDLTKWIVVTTTVIGGLLLAFGTFLIIAPAVVAGLAAIGTTFSAAIWPITLVVAAIAAVIGIGMLLWENWEKMSVGVKIAIAVMTGGIGLLLIAGIAII